MAQVKCLLYKNMKMIPTSYKRPCVADVPKVPTLGQQRLEGPWAFLASLSSQIGELHAQ